MTQHTDISVIIPTYRPGNYLWQCIDSLLSQTLQKNLYEIIIVLNGPKEPYNNLIRKYILENDCNDNISLIACETAGVSNARNIGIENAKGRYICFVDDDDWVSDCYLEQLLNTCNYSKSVVEANVMDYDEDNSTYKNDYLTSVYNDLSAKDKDYTVFAARRVLSSSCCKLIPVEAIGTVRFNRKYKIGEDALFMAEISKNISCIRLSNPEAIYYRRLRANSASRTTITYNYRICNAFSLCKQYLRIYLSSPLQYSLPFFINRMMAVAKITIILTFSKHIHS